MNDARERLRQAGELIPAPAEPFERLLRRRDRRRRRERVMAGALSLALVAADGNIVTETWWKSDGSGRAAFDCTIPNCDKVWGSGPTGTFGPGEFPTDSDVTELSTDPAVLANQLLDRTGPNGKSPEPDQISPGPEDRKST